MEGSGNSVTHALPPGGGLGGFAPQESPLITRALPPQRPCLAPVPCPQFFFVRNFFVGIFSSEFFSSEFFLKTYFFRPKFFSSGMEVRGGTGSSGLQNSRGIHSTSLNDPRTRKWPGFEAESKRLEPDAKKAKL